MSHIETNISHGDNRMTGMCVCDSLCVGGSGENYIWSVKQMVNATKEIQTDGDE